ncbi:hypothetical protein L2D01_08060 [Hyphomonadaceae bacterium ML37]|nr:hypothetical protein L2D01_08060 [Hyphomonadaceae bacterium ML37]
MIRSLILTAMLVLSGLTGAAHGQPTPTQPGAQIQAVQPPARAITHRVSFVAPRQISCVTPSNINAAAPSCAPEGSAYCPARVEWRVPGRAQVQTCPARCELETPPMGRFAASSEPRCECTVAMADCR